MIFVSVGTNETRFDRMVEAVVTLPQGSDLFVQYGSSLITEGDGEWREFLSFEEMEQAMRAADVVVCHAGAGSILLARRCGHRPIVMARLGELGEAVDDHQLIMARRLHASGVVTLVADAAELRAAVAAACLPGAGAGDDTETARLAADVRGALDSFAAPRQRRSRRRRAARAGA